MCPSNSSVFLFLVFVFPILDARAAPCCGGSSAIPNLITGDDRAQIQASVSRGVIIGDAPPSGLPVFRAPDDDESLSVFNLSGAYRIFDRGQIGASIPIVSRAMDSPEMYTTASGLGDLLFDFGYELIPDYTYSRWRPKGFVFLQVTLPTGPSTYDSVEPFQIDSRGRGFTTIGVGMVFLKTVSDFDFILTFEAHRSLPRTSDTGTGMSLEIVPSFGGTALLGAGWSPGGGSFRIGASLSPVYEGSMETYGDVESVSEPQLAWNTSIQAGYMLSDEWSLGLNYTDQTLMGPAHNVSLSRSVAFSVQHRWPL